MIPSPRKKKHSFSFKFVVTNFEKVLILCCVIVLCITFLSGSILHVLINNNDSSLGLPSLFSAIATRSASFRRKKKNNDDKEQGQDGEKPKERITTSIDRKAHLSCTSYTNNGKYQYNDAIVQEMVYWQNIPSDWAYKSPYFSNEGSKQSYYLTFELDVGGWNNVRMALETVLALACAMGRILVLPPQQEIYLLAQQNNDGKQGMTTIEDIFPLDEIKERFSGIQIISMKEFLQQEASRGKLFDRRISDNNIPVFAPNNITDWDGKNADELYTWLESGVVAKRSEWNHEKCVAIFPTDPADGAHNLEHAFQSMITTDGIPSYEKYINRPTPVYSHAIDRLMEQMNGRSELCIYDNILQKERIIHFVGGRKLSDLHNGRLLTHFYSFLFFENWKQDVWTKRFIRDNVRYKDSIQCAAARIVTAIYQQLGFNNTFDAFHVRRGEFQYKKAKISSQEMYNISSNIIPDGSTVYIATDEPNKREFFADMSKHYNLVFLEDYMYLLEDDETINPNLYGMIEQLICSQARIFFGCWFSTFTSYINRIRGYHVDMKKSPPGFQRGIIPSYYYAMAEHKMRMRQYWPISGMVYSREFPVSWRNIDQGIQG